MLAEFGRFCRTIDLQPPTIPFLSNVTGDWITVSQATDPEYWVTHLRSTVRFADCLETVRAQGEPVLLEIGPGRTLSMLARAQTTPATHAYNSMRHPDESTSDVAFALSTVGKVWAAGVPVDWSALYDGQLRNRVPLPTYAWDHERFWVDAPTPSSTPEPTTPTATSSHRPQVSDWFERPVWHQTLPVAPATLLTNVDAESEASRRRVLLFTDSSALAEQFEQCLVEAGCDITRVHRGAAFKQDAQTFTIRPAESDDYDRLLKAVTRDGAVPGRIVHMWSVTDATQPVTFDAILEHGFHSLHAFGRALANENPDAAFTLYAMTSDLQRVGGESRLEPAKALLLGPARVMPREFPNVRTRAIDVVMSAAMSPVRLAAQLAADVLSDSTADTIALRGADRYEQRREPVRLDPISPRLRERGVYLITGGLGGLGLTVAEHLARTRQARLVLVGRRAPGARTRVHLASLAAMGAEVEFVQADLRDADQARTAVARARERFGALHGVFHTAGTLNDSLFAFKTRADAEGVLAPKVQGTLALDAALGEAPLDLFVLFSSISSIAGLAGQADYTAANAFLDAFAHARSARDGSCVVAVNWSAWRDVGMAARLAGAADGGTGEEEVHPVLGRRLFAGGDTELFGAELSTASHWVVNEHRLRGGPSLMPGTGHLELVCAAAQSRPASGVLEIRDLNFMSPLLMPEDGAREMRVQVAAMADGQRAIAIGGRSETADGTGVWREHVTATAAYRDLSAPVALDVSAIAGRCTARMETFAPDQESVNMAFGPRWKNLQSIRYGQGEALVTLELPREFLADLDAYTLHPALMDMATGRCEALAAGFNPATDFYVPLSYTRVRVYAPLTARLFSHVRVAESDFDPREFLVFNATIADAQGRVLAEVDEFVMTRVTDKTQLNDQVARGEARRAHARFEVPAAAAAAPPMVQRLEVGIRPDEGMQALEYILAGPALPQLFATPEPVDALVAALRRPPERAVAMVDETVAPPIQPKVEVEAALMAHEAVREVAVLERMNRQGTAKLVAYPVFATGTRATGSDLRRFLKSRVPSHLVPSTYVDLDGLPRTADGAVDYAALPDPFGVVDQHVAPRTATEEVMAEIWKEVLGVSRVGVHDNFFDAGGHSLLAVRVIIRLDKKIGVRLTQANMVLQTLEQLAADCDRRIAATGNAAAVAQ